MKRIDVKSIRRLTVFPHRRELLLRTLRGKNLHFNWKEDGILPFVLFLLVGLRLPLGSPLHTCACSDKLELYARCINCVIRAYSRVLANRCEALLPIRYIVQLRLALSWLSRNAWTYFIVRAFPSSNFTAAGSSIWAFVLRRTSFSLSSIQRHFLIGPHQAKRNLLSLAEIRTNPMASPADQAAELAKLPGLTPPEGIAPNFINPYSRQYLIVATTAITLTVVTLFVAIRTYTKLFIHKTGLGWDDCRSLCIGNGTKKLLTRTP